jgi:hypothetical protein
MINKIYKIIVIKNNYLESKYSFNKKYKILNIIKLLKSMYYN